MIAEDNLKLAEVVKRAVVGSSSKESQGGSQALAIANAVVNDVKDERSLKNIQPEVHWDFYHSWQEKYFVQRKGEDDAQFEKRKKDGKPVNYVRFIVNLDTRFLYGRPKKIGRLYGKSKKTESRMREINRLISINNLQMEAKRQACIYGEQGFRLIPVDKRTKSQVSETTKIDENVYPHPVPLDPRFTFFLLNPYGRIVAVVIKRKFKDYVDQEKTVDSIELITDDSRWLWYDDTLKKAEINKYSLIDEFVLQKNNEERIDDIQDVLKLQTALNEVVSDNSYFFAKHGRPQLVSTVDLSNVINKGDAVWQIDLDNEQHVKVLEQIGFLVWDGQMEQAKEHADGLEAKMFKVSSTAAISTGDLKGIGNLRSGAALLTAFASSIQKALESQIIWEKNEEELANAIISFDSLIHGMDKETRFPEFEFTMRFPKESGVPGEEILNAEVRQININSHLKTLKDLVMDENPGFSDEEVDEYVKQIIKDSETLGDALRIFQQKEDPNANNNSSGSKKSAEQQ